MERTYILEPGSYLAKSGDHLKLYRDRQLVSEIPLKGLKQLTLVGYTTLSGPVLSVLSQNRVETVLLDPHGRFITRLAFDEHKHVQRRQAQYLKLSSPDVVLRVSKKIVRGKLKNSARFLAKRAGSYDNQSLFDAAGRLKALASLSQDRRVLEDVRGIEGFGANVYFDHFPHLMRTQDFAFNGRNRRPPLDPVNAMLSFVYTLLTQEVLTAIMTAGLDPYLGALHAVSYGRPSLACDLVEEWRAFLGDRLVLAIINRGMVKPVDFVIRKVKHTDGIDDEDIRRKRPVEMKPEFRRALIRSYEKWMATRIKWPDTGERTDYRGLIFRQVRKFSAWLMDDEEEYTPFPWSQVG